LVDTVTCLPNTPTGTAVSVSLLGGTTSGVGGVDVTFADVSAPGSTSVTGSNTGPPPPTGFQVVGLSGAPFFYDINTTATFTGPITLCVHYDETGLTPAEESGLRLMQDDGSGFVDRTTSLDTTANIICGSAPSFSTWAVMLEQGFPPPGPPVVGGVLGLVSDEPDARQTAPEDGSRLPSTVGLAAFGLVALAGSAVYLRRRSAHR
jgi:MYXO-CTERM domain-containing protein